MLLYASDFENNSKFRLRGISLGNLTNRTWSESKCPDYGYFWFSRIRRFDIINIISYKFWLNLFRFNYRLGCSKLLFRKICSAKRNCSSKFNDAGFNLILDLFNHLSIPYCHKGNDWIFQCILLCFFPGVGGSPWGSAKNPLANNSSNCDSCRGFYIWNRYF